MILLDELELAVLLVDFAGGIVQPLGRSGAGPGEYGWPNQLLPLRGDTTAVKDGMHGRLLFILPEQVASGVATLQGRPTSEPALSVPNVVATDTAGGLFGYLPTAAGRDSALLVRWERTGVGLDTVARVPPPGGQVVRGTTFTGSVGPYHAEVSWSVAPDGRVAVLHPEPYRVDFVSRNGTIVRGQSLQYSRIRLTEAHKESWRATAKAPRIGLMVAGTRANPVSSAQKMSRPFREPTSWPEFLPPFLPGAGTFSPRGDYWVRRIGTTPEATEYDVIDAAAKRKARVRLPDSTRIVGFGTNTICVARTDDDGLQHLRRFKDPFDR